MVPEIRATASFAILGRWRAILDAFYHAVTGYMWNSTQRPWGQNKATLLTFHGQQEWNVEINQICDVLCTLPGILVGCRHGCWVVLQWHLLAVNGSTTNWDKPILDVLGMLKGNRSKLGTLNAETSMENVGGLSWTSFTSLSYSCKKRLLSNTAAWVLSGVAIGSVHNCTDSCLKVEYQTSASGSASHRSTEITLYLSQVFHPGGRDCLPKRDLNLIKTMPKTDLKPKPDPNFTNTMPNPNRHNA